MIATLEHGHVTKYNNWSRRPKKSGYGTALIQIKNPGVFFFEVRYPFVLSRILLVFFKKKSP